jgi:tRNA (cytosine49-C5)-methyltransferase
MARQQAQRKGLRLQERERLFITRTTSALGVSETKLRHMLSGERLSTVRINTLAAHDKNGVLKKLKNLDKELRPVPWAPDSYFISDKQAITQSDLFQNGEIYVQTASSLIPAIALDPHPEDRVLDLCAAPGGKACHSAALAHGNIRLWVNDAIKPRIKKLREVLAWQHVEPVEVTQYPAQYTDKFLEHESFDRILLDAQCTGEGRIDLSRPQLSFKFWNLKRIHEYSRLQQRMLKSAYRLLKPDGVLVYSTCTIAPEENEVPINQLVRHTDAKIESFTIDIPEAMPGITVWNHEKLDPSVKGALRIKPSTSMEAFFVCRIRKPIV